jgi:putative PEP-CTERM system TPR-repeat lipoprotein
MQNAGVFASVWHLHAARVQPILQLVRDVTMKNIFRTLCCASLLLFLLGCGDDATSTEHVDRAREFINEANYDAALIELKNAVQKEQNSAEARFMLGQLQLQMGNVAAAEKELLAAEKLGWAKEAVSPALAQALLLGGKYAQIRELDARALPADSKAQVLTIQALAELAQGELAAAERLIAEARQTAPESVDVMVGAARVSASQGSLEGAISTLDEALVRGPDNASAWHLLGDIRLQQGQPEEALAAYNKTLELQPNNFQARVRRALAAMSLQDFTTASNDAETLLKMAPRHPGSNYIQGLVHFQAQNYEDAIAALTQAEPAFRQFPMVLYYLGSSHLIEGSNDLAESFADRFVAVAPENVAGRKLLATLRLQRGDYRDVQSLLQPVLDNDPDDLGALNLMANALIRDGKTDRGIDLLSRLAELQPDSAQAQVRLGAGLLMTGKSDAAINHIETALQLDPEFQQADILLVLNHLRKQEYDSAIEAARAYVGRNPTSVTPYNLLGKVYLAADREADARQAFGRALKIDAGDPGANHNLAQLALTSGDTAAARKHYLAVLAVHKDSVPALMQLARLEAQLNDEDAMVSWLQQATEAAPEAIEPRVMLARYYLGKGRPAQVAPLFSSLDQVQRQSPEVLRALAMAQLAEKEPREAQQTLEQLLESEPDSAVTRQLMAQAAAGAGDRDRAKLELQRALELDQNYLPARVALARLALAGESADEFDEQLQLLVAQAPDDVNVLQLQARAAQRNNEPTAAAEFARRAYELAPGEATLLALAGYETAAGRETESLNLLEEWLRANPDSVPVRLARGIALGQTGKVDASLGEYLSVIEVDPDNFAALNNLAWELRETDTKRALEYAQRATRAAPNSAAGLDTLAVVEYHAGDYEAAKRNIARALEADPDIPALNYHAAMIEKALGDEPAAARILQRLLSEHSDFPEYNDAKALLDSLSP